jgi:hypothetical protein
VKGEISDQNDYFIVPKQLFGKGLKIFSQFFWRPFVAFVCYLEGFSKLRGMKVWIFEQSETKWTILALFKISTTVWGKQQITK